NLPHTRQARIALDPELVLMPYRVWLRQRADLVERRHPPSRHSPGGRRQIVAKLCFIASADDHRVHSRLVHYPIQGDLCRCDVASRRDLDELVNDAINAFEVDGAGHVEFIETADRGARRATTEFSRQ